MAVEARHKALQRRFRLALRRHRRLPALVLIAAALTLLAGVTAQLLHAGVQEAPHASTVEAPDADGDRVPDVFENAVLGSDPRAAAPAGTLPEAWLSRYGLDVADADLAGRTAPYPRPPESPEAYGVEGLPPEHRMTYWDVYAHGRPADWDEAEDGPWDSGLDPRRWDVNGTGVPYAWLVRHGLDPHDAAALDARAPGIPWTPREAYARGLHPTSLDGDRDGLEDVTELSLGTNPRRTSTAGTGIADGWLVRHGLDPKNPAVADQDPDSDGLTNRQEFEASMRLRPAATLAGRGLDPRAQSTVNGPVPDGWLVRVGLDPFDPDVANATTEMRVGENGTVEARLTVLDEYRVNRPPGWNESRNGPWLGGTDPARNDTDADGVQDLDEILGWRIVIGDEPRHVVSDPTRADSDDDGLTDAEEERGRRGDLAFGRTNPSVADTDADGLRDGEEVGVVEREGRTLPPLDPTHPDTDRDGLLDGDEADYWLGRHRTYADDPAATYEWGPAPPPRARDVFARAGLAPTAALDLLLPGGDLDGDGQANILDPDADGDDLADGWEVHPELYRETPHAAPQARPRTDPGNKDTDLDTLPDGWEVRYGLYDATRGGWNLNPALWSSSGDTVSDADADLDGDGTTWYSFHTAGAGRVATPHPFVATNRVEYEAGSDPNRYSSSPDGLPDGWKIFWGSLYLGLSDEERGEVYPGAPGELRIPDDRPLPRIGADDGGALGTHRYRRYQPGDATTLLAWERVERVDPAFRDLSDRPAPYRVVGATVQIDYKGAAENFTNPYLSDTDGDGAPDAWESTWSRLGTLRQRVSPVSPDGEGDPDGDGLRNVEESAIGTSPYAADSDLGGAPDGVESRLATDPLDPTDDRRTIDQSTDTDEDGVPDTLELLGRALGPSGELRSTDPRHPDTDRDGLLDGKSLSAILGRKPSATADRALLDALRDRGLLVRVFADGTADVFGEETLASDPALLSTGGDGVPDGWLALHSLPPGSPSGLRDAYAYGRPSWWNESLDGVWLWGLKPDAAPTRDHDKDGLDDLNGEDPMPFSNRRNALPEGDPLAPDLPPEERLRRARHYGDLPPADATIPYRVRANVTLDPLPEPLAANGTVRFTGNVTVEGTTTRVANATVVLSLGVRGLDVGVAVTNATGVFNGSVLLAPRVPADPATAGVPAFGRTDGTGVHENAPHLLASIDPREPVRLFAWAYNVSPFATGPQGATYLLPNGSKGAGLRSNDSAPQNRTLHLPTAFRVDNATLDGTDLVLNLTLTDGLGRGVPDVNVTLRTADEKVNETARTNAEGKVFRTLRLGATLGPRVVVASFNGSAALLPSQASVETFVRATPVLVLDAPRLAARANGSFAVAGRLHLTDGAGVPDARVSVLVAGLHAEGATGADGAFRLVVRVPANAPLGNATALVAFAGNDTLDAARASVPLSIVGRPSWTVASVLAPLDATPNVTATLRDARGLPVAGMRASLHHGDALVATGFTDARGNVTLPARLAHAGPGTHTLRLRASDPVEGDAEAPVLVTLVSPTRLEASASDALRGSAVVLEGALRDVLTRGLASRAVDVEILGKTSRAVTGPDGRWRVEVPLTADDPLGAAVATVRHAGTADGVFHPSTARVPVLVRDGVDVRLDRTTVQLSSPALDGALLTLTGEPLAGREVRLSGAGGEAVAVTDVDGRFHLVPPLAPDQRLGPAEFTLRVPAERLLAAHESRLSLLVRDAGRIHARLPAFAIEGGAVELEVALLDSRGLPASDARVNVTLADARLAPPQAPGLLRLPLPEDARAGTHRLRIEASSPLVAAPALEAPLEVRRATLLALDAADPLLPTREGAIRVVLVGGGAPLPDRALDVLAGGRTLRVVTDASGVAEIPLSSLARGTTSVELRFPGTPQEGPAALTVALRAGDLPPAREDGSSWWVALVVALAVVAAAMIAIQRRRGAVAQTIAKQARLLRSDRADVKRLYASYLALLELAGLDEDAADTMTFREVAARVVVVGPETAAAIDTLAEAYGLAAYAPDLLDAATLARAADALQRLSEHTREDEDPTHAPRPAGEVAT